MGSVVSVSADKDHGFSKIAMTQINLISGMGVEGDAHRRLDVV